MELLDRYLNEVSRHLPRKDRDDILAELRSLLQDQLDDRLADGPDNLPKDEVLASLLREFGAPRQVAASYSGDRHLVGPALYPTLMMVLRIGLIVTGILFIVGLLASMSVSPADLPVFLLETVADFIQSMLAFVGIAVIIFAVLEHFDVKVQTAEEIIWDPGTLPAANDPGRVQRIETFVGVAFSLVFLFILNYFRQVGGFTFMIYPGSTWQVIPIASGLLIASMGIIFAQIVTDLFVLLQGRWQVGTRLFHTALDVAGLAVGYPIFLQIAHGVREKLPADLSVIAPGDRLIGLFFTIILGIILLDNGIKTIKLALYRPLYLPTAHVSNPAREG